MFRVYLVREMMKIKFCLCFNWYRQCSMHGMVMVSFICRLPGAVCRVPVTRYGYIRIHGVLTKCIVWYYYHCHFTNTRSNLKHWRIAFVFCFVPSSRAKSLLYICVCYVCEKPNIQMAFDHIFSVKIKWKLH